jgi:hypothetical protein
MVGRRPARSTDTTKAQMTNETNSKARRRPPASELLAGVDCSDANQIELAFRLLKSRHRQRPDVRARILELAERKQRGRR